jgi:arylsulfatase A-like enzyme
MHRETLLPALVATCLVLAAAHPVSAEKPNILIVFTDDQGYADLGCYGSTKHKTPRLDRLAKEGTRFTSFYAQAVCGPSRSALLTGRYPAVSLGWSMPAREITWAELMRKAGYQTACIGKWDVSDRRAIIPRMPNAQGFDYYFGTLGANDGGHVGFHENNKKAGGTHDMGSLTRLYTDKAIDYLENKRNPDKPFALYVAHTMVHMNIDASDRFQGTSKGGLYGDVVEEFDHETGRLLDALDKLKLSDNTLVIYTTDNGAWNQKRYYQKKRREKRYVQWKKRHARFKKDDIFWGDSGPLRNGKGSPYEGGYRVPCIVRWPGKVPAGRTSHAVFATIDFLPTFAGLAGFDVPKDRTVHGIDQTKLLLGKTEKGRDSFYYDKAGIRVGKWKYLKPRAHFYGYSVEAGRSKVDELYNLEDDIGEKTNLAEKHPEKAQELKKQLAALESEHKQQKWKKLNAR